MYVVIEHEVTNPKFWEIVRKAEAPSNLKLHQVFSNEKRKSIVFLWEASALDEVREFVEKMLGIVSNNTYFITDIENVSGLLTAVTQRGYFETLTCF